MRTRYQKYLEEEKSTPDRKFPLPQAPVDQRKLHLMNLRKLNDKFLHRNPQFVNQFKADTVKTRNLEST